MKFKGTPNMLVTDHRTNKKYRFDENGFFETDNEDLARKFARKFEEVKPVKEIANGKPDAGRLQKENSKKSK